MHTKNVLRPAFIAALLLLIPFLMRFDWTPSDFIVMGVMLFVVGLGIEFVATRTMQRSHKIIGAAIIVFLFLWLWVELAVGLFTNWGS
jgi:hypothetical protein